MKKYNSVYIGKTCLKHGLMLAPMAGVTDSVMRRLCAMCGADYVTTEMVSAAAVYYGDKKTMTLAETKFDIAPCAVQLFGSDPDKMAYAVDYIYNHLELKPVAFDINMGCPVKKIVSNGEGSALMDNIPLAARVAESAVKASPVPVTVKMRTGHDSGHISAPELAAALEQVGVSALCIHGRTRAQMYEPDCVEFETAARVKQLVKIPVFANGDIKSGADAIRALELSGCDGVAVGRGAFGNPFVFSEIVSYFEDKPFNCPTYPEIIDYAIEHTKLMVEQKGHIGLLESRKHICKYLKGIPGASESRVKINTSESLDKTLEILNELKNKILQKGE